MLSARDREVKPHPTDAGVDSIRKRRAAGLCVAVLITGGGMCRLTGAAPTGEDSGPGRAATAKADEPGAAAKPTFRASAVRYLVKDVGRSVAFFTEHLGFKTEQRSGPAFAIVSSGGLTLWLSGPSSSGARPMPDGRRQAPGGWNRFVLEVDDLPSCVATLKKAGLRFRNEIETGPGGKQIQLEDPDGNPIELFEPAS